MEYLRLGDLYLTVSDGLTGFSDSQSYNFAIQDMASGKPILQAIGAALNQLSLTVSLRTVLGHKIDEIKKQMDDMILSGEPQKFVFANGVYVGQYVITERGATINRTSPDGTIVEADFTLSLTEFADRVIIVNRSSETKPKTENSQRKTQTI